MQYLADAPTRTPQLDLEMYWLRFKGEYPYYVTWNPHRHITQCKYALGQSGHPHRNWACKNACLLHRVLGSSRYAARAMQENWMSRTVQSDFVFHERYLLV